MNDKKKNTEPRIAFPASVLRPLGEFLKGRLALLQRRKKEIEKEDPFKDTDRIIDNASPDTEAAEQFGHARTSAIRQHLQRNIIQTKKAITMLRIGRYGICEDCGKMIDTDRLMVYPETTLCTRDAAKREGK